MNVFHNYLLSKTIAKAELTSAEERSRRGDTAKAIESLIRSVKEFQTATNCLASLAFEKKRKKRRQVKNKGLLSSHET